MSVGRKFQSQGAMTDKAFIQRCLDIIMGIDRTDESDDLVDRDGKERQLNYCKDMYVAEF